MPGMYQSGKTANPGSWISPNFVLKFGKPSILSNKSNVVNQLALPSGWVPLSRLWITRARRSRIGGFGTGL